MDLNKYPHHRTRSGSVNRPNSRRIDNSDDFSFNYSDAIIEFFEIDRQACARSCSSIV
jgi:hypothetical protein